MFNTVRLQRFTDSKENVLIARTYARVQNLEFTFLYNLPIRP